MVQRPLTGYGFSAFWGTPEVVYGLGDNTTWANAATDAHNAYLNLAVTIGIPGMLLVVLWVVVLPIADFCRRTPERGDRGAANAVSARLPLRRIRVML